MGAARGPARTTARALLDLVEVGWGTENPAYRKIFAELFAPDADESESHSLAELQRLATEPRIASRLIEAAGEIDVRASLDKVRSPTLVMHARDDARVPFEQGRLLAASIPGAEFVPLESRNHALLEHDPAWLAFKREFRSFAHPSRDHDDLGRIEGEYGELTIRELAVAQHVAAGLGNMEIGRRLGISEKTVRNHVTRIFDKLGVHTRAELIVLIRDRSSP
jgi:DNA-binding CsgD family transcriptional regulator